MMVGRESRACNHYLRLLHQLPAAGAHPSRSEQWE
jgi:hypothetical protein